MYFARPDKRETTARLALLLVYLFAWGGSALGAPMLLMLVGAAHDVTIFSVSGEMHVVLHHHEESVAGSAHGESTSDTSCGHTAGQADCADHSDHEFHFPDQQAPIALRSAALPASVLPAGFSTILRLNISEQFSRLVTANSLSPPSTVLLILSTVVLVV